MVWARRGLGRFVFAMLVGFVVWMASSDRHWQLEFDWAARYTGAYVLFGCVLIAASVASDVARHARPDLT